MVLCDSCLRDCTIEEFFVNELDAGPLNTLKKTIGLRGFYSKEFVIDINCIGYKCKAHAVRNLKSNYVNGVDYIYKSGKYYLTVTCAQILSMDANTPEGDTFYEHFVYINSCRWDYYRRKCNIQVGLDAIR